MPSQTPVILRRWSSPGGGMRRVSRMGEWGCGLAVLGLVLAGALLWVLARAYFVVGVSAEYPQGMSFTGRGPSGRITYYGLAWIREDRDPRPCPLVIHLADGDLAAADL